MEMDMDDEDHPQNSGEMISDVMDIVDDFEQSGSCCFEACSRRRINSLGKMREFILDNKESLQAHNPRMFVKTYKLLLLFPPLPFCVFYFDAILHSIYDYFCNHSEHKNGSSLLCKNLPV